MTNPTEEIAAENLTFLISEVSKARLTVIVTDGKEDNVALAEKLVEVLPATLVENYSGVQEGNLVVVPSLTSYLETDASLILKLDASKTTPVVKVTKNRSGKLGELPVHFASSTVQS